MATCRHQFVYNAQSNQIECGRCGWKQSDGPLDPPAHRNIRPEHAKAVRESGDDFSDLIDD